MRVGTTNVNTGRAENTIAVAGQWRLMWNAFRKRRLALLGGTIIGLFCLLALFAEFFAPYDPEARDPSSRPVPPTRIHIMTSAGKLHRPFVYQLVEARDTVTRAVHFTEQTDRIHPIRFFVRAERYRLCGLFAADVHLFGTDDSQRFHLLGTDQQARDVFSRLVYGTRASIGIGILAAAISLLVAMVLGTIAGYGGGPPDAIVRHMGAVIISIPSLPLWMALAVVIPAMGTAKRDILSMVIVLALVGWTSLARTARDRTHALREADYVCSAKLDNVPALRRICRHVIPGTVGHLTASFAFLVPCLILGETSLSFLGLGLSAPRISWGALLQSALDMHAMILAPWLLAPVVPIVVIILSFYLLADGLRDTVDLFDGAGGEDSQRL